VEAVTCPTLRRVCYNVTMKLDELRYEAVHPLIGSAFHISVPERGEVDLKITDVSRVMERVKSTRFKREPFTIHLLGPRDVRFSQGMYPFRHDELGELEMFIVPLGGQEDGLQYEAVFT
jgi:hypothetical protein